MALGLQDRINGRFATPELFLSDLDAGAAANLITAAADVVLIVDDAGVIRDLAFGNDELLSHGCNDWLGKTWAQTVTLESQPKVEALLRDANGADARERQVNHPCADGTSLPISYSVVPLKRSAKPGGKAAARATAATARGYTVAFGRDLRAQAALQQRLVAAQLSMERDYWRLRHVETRYRLLFQIASEAVLILDATTDRLEEANPAAHKLFGEAVQRSGWTLANSLGSASMTQVRQLLERLRANGRADPLLVRLADGTDDYVLSASLFRQENAPHFLIRLTPAGQAEQGSYGNARQMLLSVMESAPDAFVVTDLDGHILTVNRAFLEMAQLASEELARGQSLEKWLGRAGVDLRVLISNLRQHSAVRLFATSMRGEYGSTTDVEISAVAVTAGDQPCLGFTVRDVARRLTNEPASGKELPRSASQMTELVGRVPLRDIVRETTDLIEQLCIEAALELTGDNRASAAEMLGLSRQSLYVKLRRFGIGDALTEGDAR